MSLLLEQAERTRFRDSLLIAEWFAPTHVHALTTLRGPAGESQPPFDSLNLGVRSGDNAEVVASNRAALVAQLNLPSQPRWLRQVHGREVWQFDDRGPATCHSERSEESVTAAASGSLTAFGMTSVEPEADAAVTTRPGVVLAILTADCMPVLFSSEDGSVIGAAHAGWRGLAAGVLESTIASMRTPPGKIIAWLGPAAGPQAYEVGDEVRAAFIDLDLCAASAFVATRPGHWLCDLYALARLRLAAVGVKRVSGGGLCTISDPQRFFSHRRDRMTGRMASLIWINRAPVNA